MENNISSIKSVMQLDDSDANYIVKLLSSVGAEGQYTGVKAEPTRFNNVMDMYVTDAKGDVYCLSVNVNGSVGLIAKDNIHGEVLWRPLPE